VVRESTGRGQRGWLSLKPNECVTARSCAGQEWPVCVDMMRDVEVRSAPVGDLRYNLVGTAGGKHATSVLGQRAVGKLIPVKLTGRRRRAASPGSRVRRES
jgi:hypothetical protein